MTVNAHVLRDFDAEMAALIRAELPPGDYTAGQIAERLVDRLWREDPDLLSGWLEEQSIRILTVAVNDLLRRQRMQSRRESRAVAFADAARQAEAGDVTALRAFEVVYVIDAANTRRHVRDMRGADHRYVAESYTDSANRAAMLAAFHLAVAERIGERTTAEVFSEEQYRSLYVSITGREA